MRPLTHLVWDWNGTLLDDIDACVRTLNDLLAARRMPATTLEQYRDVFGFPVHDAYLALGFDLEHENWDDICREFHDAYDIHSRASRIRTGIPAVLAAGRERGLPMWVLSASETSLLTRMMTTHAVTGWFKGVFGLSDWHARSKLDAGRELMKTLACEPADVLLIGDTLHDHEVATALGCRCLLMEGGHQSRRRIEAAGCPVISGPADILSAII
jgi:phosphoglycolate phosphatase